MSNQIHNERVKLRADYINNLAAVAMSTGVIIPAVTATLTTQELGWRTLVPFFVGAAAATGLRLLATAELGYLKED
ncbi:hypothetical protein [Mesorhizobium sp.]|uniref:hypothetical protein n=1 Tax=Mesorhizobium sp. TaxID=1871066 RepID=UPI000FEA540F|nr:hypothetical protein [Mesorhizobium sp.]RWH17208.1 MAG: hypothetical protein EOQ76_30330 [Mesorhizobium sp.]